MTTPPTTNRSLALRRRGFLARAGTVAVAALAGCTASARPDGPAEVPSPVALDGGKQDDFGGMIIGEHFGPNGQVFYRGQEPHGPGTPAWFHTLARGLFPYYFERERLGWEAVAVYVTDYSAVDYDLVERGDRTFVSTHTAAATFGDARAMHYVAGSDVLGGMGPELIPFGEASEAESFRAAHGGALVGFGDVTEAGLVHLGHDHEH